MRDRLQHDRIGFRMASLGRIFGCHVEHNGGARVIGLKVFQHKALGFGWVQRKAVSTHGQDKQRFPLIMSKNPNSLILGTDIIVSIEGKRKAESGSLDRHFVGSRGARR